MTRLWFPPQWEREVIWYRGEGFYMDVPDPTWDRIVHAVSRLDGADFNDEARLSLQYSDYKYLSVVGSIDNAFAMYLYSENTGDMFAEDINRKESEEFVYLGEIPGIPERFTYDLESALRILRHFYEFGEGERNLSWVKWADIETDPAADF